MSGEGIFEIGLFWLVMLSFEKSHRLNIISCKQFNQTLFLRVSNKPGKFTNNNTLQGHKEWQFSLWHQRSCLLVRVKAPYCTVTSIASLCTHTHTQKEVCVFTFTCACHAHTFKEQSLPTSCATDNRTVHTGLHSPYIWVCAKIKHLQH